MPPTDKPAPHQAEAELLKAKIQNCMLQIQVSQHAAMLFERDLAAKEAELAAWRAEHAAKTMARPELSGPTDRVAEVSPTGEA